MTRSRPAPRVSDYAPHVPPKLLCPICGVDLVRRHTTDLKGRPIAFWACLRGRMVKERCRYTLACDVFEAYKAQMIAKWHDTRRLDELEARSGVNVSPS